MLNSFVKVLKQISMGNFSNCNSKIAWKIEQGEWIRIPNAAINLLLLYIHTFLKMYFEDFFSE